MTKADYYSALHGERKLIADPGIGFMDKIRHLHNADKAQEASEAQARRPQGITVKKVMHGVAGALLGLGAARLAAHKFDVPPQYAGKLQWAAMGLGAAVNMGLTKNARDNMEEDRRRAFRLGFVKAAYETGLIDQPQEKLAGMMPVPMVNLSPSALMAIPRSVASTGRGVGTAAGSIVGAVDAADEDEEDIAKLRVRHELLKERLQQLQADRQNSALRKLLAKRRTA